MGFRAQVELHEARGMPRHLAIDAARIIVEARSPRARWEEMLHPRSRIGQFIERDAHGNPAETSGFPDRVPAVTPRQLEGKLRKAGWKRMRQRGSHALFSHPDAKRSVVVPMHGRSVPRGTLMNILGTAAA